MSLSPVQSPQPDESKSANLAASPTTALDALRNRTKEIGIGIAVLAALLFGGHWLLVGRFEIKTDNAYIRADISHIATKVQGYVKTVHVQDNQPVKAGDLLITLFAEDYEAKLAAARAELAQAEAAAVRASAEIAAHQAAIATAEGKAAAQRDLLGESQAAADAALASAELSTADAERYAELAEKGWYPRARVEAASAAETSSHAHLAQAIASVTARRSQLASAQAGVTQAQEEFTAATAAARASQANVEAAKAGVTSAQLTVDQALMHAPVDGIVTNRTVAPGQLVQPGQIALSVVPEAKSYVIANFKETQVANMHPGQPVKIKVDAYPDLKIDGRIASLSPATGATFSLIPQDTATGNFTKIVQRVPVRIDLNEKAQATGLMRSGLAVIVTVNTKSDTEPPNTSDD